MFNRSDKNVYTYYIRVQSDFCIQILMKLYSSMAGKYGTRSKLYDLPNVSFGDNVFSNNWLRHTFSVINYVLFEKRLL